MDKATVGARPLNCKGVKPVTVQNRGKCPCDSFKRCNGRLPYGYDIWGNPKKREQAMAGMVYSRQGAISDIAKKTEVLNRFGNKYKNSKWTIFYRNFNTLLDHASGGEQKVMVFPELKKAAIDAGIASLKAGRLSNKGNFTAFQKTMILRANLVRNGNFIKSDWYFRPSGEIEFASEKLMPYSREHRDEMWAVDHIQVRSKGGCNRFCNAGLLKFSNNSNCKNDDGPGCPCVDAYEKNKKPDGDRPPFDYPNAKKEEEACEKNKRKGPAYKLYECFALYTNRESGVDGLPEKPPATIKKYKKICDVDDPRDFTRILAKRKNIDAQVAAVCK